METMLVTQKPVEAPQYHFPSRRRRRKQKWTEMQVRILEQRASSTSLTELSKILHRSGDAVASKRLRMGLPGYRNSTDDLSVNQICLMMGVTYRKVRKWERFGLPIKHSENSSQSAITQDDLIKFLRTHQDMWDAAKVKDDSILRRYAWFKKKYEADKPIVHIPRYWSEVDEARLKTLCELGASYEKMSKVTGRSVSAVRSKVWHMTKHGKLLRRI